MRYGTYFITNKLNGKAYVGKYTGTPAARWSNHRWCPSVLAKAKPTVIQLAIKKYGAENFRFEVLTTGLEEQEAWDHELDMIDVLNTMTPYGYNTARGGGGASGFVFSAESRARMRASSRERWGPQKISARYTKGYLKQLTRVITEFSNGMQWYQSLFTDTPKLPEISVKSRNKLLGLRAQNKKPRGWVAAR